VDVVVLNVLLHNLEKIFGLEILEIAVGVVVDAPGRENELFCIDKSTGSIGAPVVIVVVSLRSFLRECSISVFSLSTLSFIVITLFELVVDMKLSFILSNELDKAASFVDDIRFKEDDEDFFRLSLLTGKGDGVNEVELGCFTRGEIGVLRPDDEDRFRVVKFLVEDLFGVVGLKGDNDDATITFPFISNVGAVSLCEATRFNIVPARPNGGGKCGSIKCFNISSSCITIRGSCDRVTCPVKSSSSGISSPSKESPAARIA
jgi:hypothetical protein